MPNTFSKYIYGHWQNELAISYHLWICYITVFWKGWVLCMFLEMVNYGWRMANGQLLCTFNSIHNYLCYCTIIILVFIFVSCSAKQKISELEAAKAAMKVYCVIMSCQDYYNWYFRRVCGLKTVKLLLVRSVKLNFQ